MQKTTPVTEAVENGTRAANYLLDQVAEATERLISDATRHDGKEADATAHLVNLSSLYVAWMKGAAKVSTTMVNNLVLLTTPIPEYFTSGFEFFGNPPPAGDTWTLSVVGGLDVDGTNLSPEPIELYGPEDSTNPLWSHQSSRSVDHSWDGNVRVVLWRYGFKPGLMTVDIEAHRTSDGALQAVATIQANMKVDQTRLGP